MSNKGPNAATIGDLSRSLPGRFSSFSDSNWKVTVREVMHQPGYIEPYAFRIETDEGVLVYSGDTGPCDAIIELAHGADMLINMCYFVTGTFTPKGKTVTSSGHKEAAFIALPECGTDKLLAVFPSSGVKSVFNLTISI